MGICRRMYVVYDDGDDDEVGGDLVDDGSAEANQDGVAAYSSSTKYTKDCALKDQGRFPSQEVK